MRRCVPSFVHSVRVPLIRTDRWTILASSSRPLLPRRHLPRATSGIPLARTNPPSGESPSGEGEKRLPNGASRTLFGRIIVETLSLCVGAFLLLAVLLWRFWQLISHYAWKALLWLSNVRQLGKWAVSRMTDVEGVSNSATSFIKSIRRLFDATLAGLRNVEEQRNHGTTVNTQAANYRPAQPTEHFDSDHHVDVESVREVFYRQDAAVNSGRRLILLRHAKTTWESEADVPDHDRVLSAKGKEEAKVVGSELSRMLWVPDVILCSDAVRTVQTLSLLEISGNDRAATTCTESLYYAVTGEEMAVAVDDALGEQGFVDDTTLMVVCHNPGCEELVERLTGRRPEMGTGCAALLEYIESEEESGDQSAHERLRLSARHGRWCLVELIRPSAILTAPNHLPHNNGSI
ncbi:Histidine phosphatase [Gracilaria domingensis]|nr:Histidine phosphatase [Gracilaria domingensis]